MSYLFYDLETTGRNRAFDQVLTFAGIRTDEDLREIDRHVIHVQLRRDIVPAPKRILRREIRAREVLGRGAPEVEAIRRIHGLLNEAGTISLGYNTLGFGDEMLRFSFFRNLLAPYTHQWENNCGRMDLFPMTIVYWLQESDLLRWPEEEGRPTLHLDHLNAVNEFVRGPLHAPEARAEASLHLARAIREEERLWSMLKDQFDRNIDRDYIDGLPAFTVGQREYRVGLMVSGKFGAEMNFQRPVICLGPHRQYNNQTAWLTLDTAKLRGAAAHPITRHAEVVSRKFGVPQFLFSPHEESVVRLDDKRRTIARRNSRWLQDHPDVFQQIAGYYLEHTYPDPPNVDVDAALYPFGFMTDAQEQLCARFHRADTVEEKVDLIDQFDSSVLRELATRIILRNYPPEQRRPTIERYARWYERRLRPEHSADRLRDHRGRGRRTPRQVRRWMRTARERNHLDSEQIELLDQLDHYINHEFGVPGRSLTSHPSDLS